MSSSDYGMKKKRERKKNRSICLGFNSHSGLKEKEIKKKGKKNKRHEPLVKETSDPDRGQNKEIGTFLFIIIIIKHTAFYIQMH